MVKGTVKRWLRGYDFIESEEHDEDVFVHNLDVQGRSELREGEEAVFDVKSTYKDPRAVNVKLVSK